MQTSIEFPNLPPPELVHAIWTANRPVALNARRKGDTETAELGDPSEGSDPASPRSSISPTSPSDPTVLGSLCTLARALAPPRPPFPQTRVVTHLGTVHPMHYVLPEGTEEPLIGPLPKARASFVEHLRLGRTIVASGVHTRFPLLNRWLATLYGRFGGRVTGNFYFAIPGATGFGPHFDSQHVLVLQTSGQKRWRIYEPQMERLALGLADLADQANPGTLLQDVVLSPGDLLAIPRGFVHDASTVSGLSAHVSLSYTPDDLPGTAPEAMPDA